MAKVKFTPGYIDLGAYPLLKTIIEAGGLEVVGGSYSREIFNFAVPAFNETINLTTTASDTVIRFNGLLSNDFNINVFAGSETQPGDRIYIFVNSDGGNIQVTFGGNLNNVNCGSNNNTYNVDGGGMVCLEMVFDGDNFTGIDNC